MAYISLSKLTPLKPLLRLEYKPAHLATIAGIEVSQGRHRAGERLAELAEALRERFVPEAAQ